MKRLLSCDPDTGVEEWFHHDEVTDIWGIQTIQHGVRDILDNNRALANDDEHTKKGIKEGGWHYASIPIDVQMRWLNEYGLQDWPMRPGNEKLLFKLLNSRDWSYLKATHKVHVPSETRHI